jgi:hypothetical protein
MMDKIHAEFWEAFKVLDPSWSTNADAQQMPPGNILVTYPLPGGGYARAVSIHIDREVITEADAADSQRRAQIIGNATRALAGRMAFYDPQEASHTGFVVQIGTEALDA